MHRRETKRHGDSRNTHYSLLCQRGYCRGRRLCKHYSERVCMGLNFFVLFGVNEMNKVNPGKFVAQ
jgi:hypothetical protein